MYLDATQIEDADIGVVDLQRVFAFILEEYKKSEGYFPSYEQVWKGLAYPEEKFMDIVSWLENQEVIEQNDGKTKGGLCIPLMQILFDSPIIKKTETEIKEIQKIKLDKKRRSRESNKKSSRVFGDPRACGAL